MSHKVSLPPPFPDNPVAAYCSNWNLTFELLGPTASLPLYQQPLEHWSVLNYATKCCTHFNQYGQFQMANISVNFFKWTVYSHAFQECLTI